MPIAQLDRASDYESEGLRFNSSWAHIFLGLSLKITDINSKVYFTNSVPLVDVHSLGFSFALSVYETLLLASGVPVFYMQHIQRMQQAFHYLNWKLEPNFYHRILLRIQSLVEHIDESISYRLKIIVSLRDKYSHLFDEIIIIEPLLGIKKDGYVLYSTGVNKAISPGIPPFLKITGNYENLIADSRAKQYNYDEALMIDTKLRVCETTFSNIFFIDDDTIITPKNDNNFLEGVTRMIVIELCKENRLKYLEKDIYMSDLFNMKQGAFLTSALKGIQPILKITLENIKTLLFTHHPIMLELQRLYEEKIYLDKRVSV